MGKIKLLASDLDGTLFNLKGELSDKNLAAISALAKRGVYFVPSTGRTLGEISPVLVNNPSIRYFIHSNGAVVYDKVTGERELNCLAANTLKRVFEILSGADIHITVRYRGVTYCDMRAANPKAYEYYNMWDAHSEILTNIAEKRTDFDTWLRTLDEVEVISLFFRSEEEMQGCIARLKEIDEVRLVSAAPYNMEIFSSTAGKGTALKYLAGKLGLKEEETAAVGDSGNDITSLCAAGTGFAVANATDELRAVADVEICSCDESAIDYILNHYIN